MLLVFLGLRSGAVEICILLGCCDAASHWVFGASVSRQRGGLLLKGWNVHSSLEDEIMLCWNVRHQWHGATSMVTGTVNVTCCCAFWRYLLRRLLSKNAQWTLTVHFFNSFSCHYRKWLADCTVLVSQPAETLASLIFIVAPCIL